MKRLALLLAFGLTACNALDGSSSYELLSADAQAARFKVTCAPSRIEVGLRQRSPLPEDATSRGLEHLPFASQVRVYDANGSNKIATTSADHPRMIWMAADKFQQAEYIGLQEVNMPFAWWRCRDYVVELDYRDVPAWAMRGTGFDPYIRKSRRP